MYGICGMIFGVILMKLALKQFSQSLVLAGLLPAVMISAISRVFDKTQMPAVALEQPVSGHKIAVLKDAENVDTMELEEYITAVLLGEVSAQFHTEALKAQAVAARTYTLYCIDILKKHNSGAVCTDPDCCQAYCSPEEYLNKGGSLQEVQKVIAAVNETAGQVMYYNSRLICATYFASSGGQTEDALEVWGSSYPYLKAVESPGEEECGYYSDQVTLAPQELMKLLDVHFTGSPASWFGMVKYTVGGGVDLIRIGGHLYTGRELRKLLNLKSTIITVTATDDAIIFNTKGYGHRVGMSQHGANAMAYKGMDYDSIVKHYYTGVSIGSYQIESNANSLEND